MNQPNRKQRGWHWLLPIAVVGAGLVALFFVPDLWTRWLPAATATDDAGHAQDPHAGHAHAGQTEDKSLELNDAAWKNIGLTTAMVGPQSYTKTVSIPGIVVERPGRSQVEITAHFTGEVTRVLPTVGQAIEPGDPLFEMRLTHEDLVTAQRDFLQTAEELDVVEREIARLESIGEGIIAGRRVLEQKYKQQKLEANLHAQRQGLLLHGLTAAELDRILDSRTLQHSLTVTAPPFVEDHERPGVEHLYHVQQIAVKRGQHVKAGDTLGVLADHCLLQVEGQAFEDDAARLVDAARDGKPVQVVPNGKNSSDMPALQLDVLYVADHVDAKSRALHFYLQLPNQLDRDVAKGDQRFVAWQYRPGQRMEVRLPIGQPWKNQIVLPAEAVVDEGADAFVFEQNGNHFDRIPVHVLYRDKDHVVINNDGTLIGSTVAMTGAYQLHLAIKNKAGSGVDPHPGHSH